MDDDINKCKQLVTKFGFGIYADAFEEGKIDMDALELMSDADISNIITVIGHRIKFKKSRDTYFSDKSKEEIVYWDIGSNANQSTSREVITKPLPPLVIQPGSSGISVPGKSKRSLLSDYHIFTADGSETLTSEFCQAQKKLRADEDLFDHGFSASGPYSLDDFLTSSEPGGSLTQNGFSDIHTVTSEADESNNSVRSKTSDSIPSDHQPCSSDPKRVDVLEEFKELINNPSSSAGRIIASFIPEGKLDNSARALLVELVVDHWIAKFPEFHIPTAVFKLLRDAIVTLFPKELPELYYVAAYTDKRNSVKHSAKGKLWYRYTRQRGRMNERKALPLKETQPRTGETADNKEKSTSYSGESRDSENRLLEWLKLSLEPWAQVEDHWRRTHKVRRETLVPAKNSGRTRTPKLTVMSYAQQFPPLMNYRGYTLFDIDFECLFPSATLNLFEGWSNFSKRFVDFAKTQTAKKKSAPLYDFLLDIATDESLSEANKAVAILHLIPFFLQQHNSRPKGKKSVTWRPSVAESQQSFVLHVKTPLEIQSALRSREDKLLSMQLSTQPLIVVVGPSITRIQSSYVAIDAHLYSLPSPLKALDVCFKSFHALHADYPYESRAVWTFIQKAIYKVVTDWDEEITCVNTLLSNIA